MINKCLYLSICIMVLYAPFVIVALNFYQTDLESYNFSGNEELVREVVHLFGKCLADTNRLISLSGKMNSVKLVEKLSESELTSLVIMSTESPLIDKLYVMAKQSFAVYNEQYFHRFEHKAQAFILAASSQPILRRQMRELRDSRWWQAEGLFLIIDDDNTMNNTCKNAREYVWLSWRYNILSSVFLCHDVNRRLMMYTYNPYNIMTPKSWVKVEEIHGRYGHPWVLFKRDASESPENCGEIYFEKRKTLNGYKIRVNAIDLSPRLLVDYNKTGFERYSGEDSDILLSILHFLNASIDEIPFIGNYPLGYHDRNGTYFGMLGDVFYGRVDIGLNARFFVSLWKLGKTYPHALASLCFVVKSKGNEPQWMNIAFVFDIWTNLGLIIIILVTAAVLSYYSGTSYGCLNTLRLLISTAMIRPPTQSSARLFLVNVFLILLLVNGVFQGKLISLLTKPRASPNPEIQQELANDGYRVISYLSMERLISDPVLRSRFADNDTETCLKSIKNGEHVTCILECHQDRLAYGNYPQLHVVRQRVQEFYIMFVSMPDWPLMERFDTLVKRLFNAGFPNYWRTRRSNLRASISDSEQNTSSTLSLEDLLFIFQWLFLGLCSAALVFLCEIITAWWEIKSLKIRRV